MSVVLIFGIIAGIVFLGFFAEVIFRKFNIPDVLLLILIGIFIGSVLKVANKDTFGVGAELFTTFALVFILFQGAININFRKLVMSLRNTLKLTLSSFFFTVLVVMGLSYFMGYDLLISLLIGMILAGTSSAVVIPLVNNVDIKNKFGVVLTLESALSDVLCIIGSITVLEIIETGQVNASGLFHSVFSAFSMALVVGLIVGLFWIFLMYKYELFASSEMLTIAVVIALYAFVESSFVLASGAIAALAFGLILGNSRTIISYSRKSQIVDDEDDKKVIRSVLSIKSKDFYREISFFVKTFFFVYLGILIDFSDLRIFLYGLVLTLGIFLVRPFVVRFVFNEEKVSVKENVLLEILVPKGLAAAVLAGLAVQSGVLGDATSSFVNLILSVVLLSIVFTSVLIFLAEKDWFKGFLPFLHKEDVKKE